MFVEIELQNKKKLEYLQKSFCGIESTLDIANFNFQMHIPPQLWEVITNSSNKQYIDQY